MQRAKNLLTDVGMSHWPRANDSDSSNLFFQKICPKAIVSSSPGSQSGSHALVRKLQQDKLDMTSSLAEIEAQIQLQSLYNSRPQNLES